MSPSSIIVIARADGSHAWQAKATVWPRGNEGLTGTNDRSSCVSSHLNVSIILAQTKLGP
jgi:hypothetical protein